jgi:hypothetical protein
VNGDCLFSAKELDEVMGRVLSFEHSPLFFVKENGEVVCEEKQERKQREKREKIKGRVSEKYSTKYTVHTIFYPL